MKKFKIAYVCPYDYFRFGGVQEHIRAVKNQLNSLGHDAWVIAPDAGSANSGGEDKVILMGGATKMNTPMATSAEISFSATPSEITDALKQHNFDILHFHEPWVPVLPKQIMARSTSHNVATFHAKLPDNLLNKSIEKFVIPLGKRINQRLELVTAVSDAAEEVLSKTTDLDIHRVPNGIDLSVYDLNKVKAYDRFDDEIINILYVGRLEKRKGVEYLLKAFKEMDQSVKARLIIAGNGPKLKSLRSYATRHKLRVEFLGFVSEEDKLKLLKTSQIFCSPAIYGESFGIVLLEAMAMNCALVAGNNVGYASVLKERGRNSLVDPHNIDLFAKKLSLLAQDEQMRKLMTDWQRDYVQDFDYKIITDQYLKLYKSL